MGIDDILRKVQSEQGNLSQIQDAMSHPSLSDSERETLRREACRIKGQDYEAIRRAEHEGKKREQMQEEVGSVNKKCAGELAALWKERIQYVKVVPAIIKRGYQGRFDSRTSEVIRQEYEATRFGKGKQLADVERRIKQVEQRRDREIKEAKGKYEK